MFPMIWVVALGLSACVGDEAASPKEGELADSGLGVGELGSADLASETFRGELGVDGAVVDGELSRTAPFHAWSLAAGASRTVSLEARGARRGDDTVLLLYAVQGGRADLAAYNDDCGPRTLDSCLTFTLSAGVSYLAVVTTWEYAFAKRPTRASYALAARCDDCERACDEPSGEGVTYVAEDPGTCAAIRFSCDPGFAPFFNDCGCGCAPVTECQVGGCSSHVCHEPGLEIITTCEWRPAYACYREATCERQADGACGWTVDDALQACLDEATGWEPGPTNEELCEATGGAWDTSSCGHYACGERPLCRALIPGCDCGPNANFVEGAGCVEDAACDADGGGGEGGCEVGGCSSHVCHEAGDLVFTTCEWRPEYACYREATCERQANGGCGWTQDDDLTACLGGM
jgi:hypothetical protein